MIKPQEIDLNTIPKFTSNLRKKLEGIEAAYFSDITDQDKCEAIAGFLNQSF